MATSQTTETKSLGFFDTLKAMSFLNYVWLLFLYLIGSLIGKALTTCAATYGFREWFVEHNRANIENYAELNPMFPSTIGNIALQYGEDVSIFYTLWIVDTGIIFWTTHAFAFLVVVGKFYSYSEEYYLEKFKPHKE